MSKPGGFFVVREVRDFLEIYIIKKKLYITQNIYITSIGQNKQVFL